MREIGARVARIDLLAAPRVRGVKQSYARVSPLYVGLDFMHSTHFPGQGPVTFSTLFNFTYIGQQVPFEKFGK